MQSRWLAALPVYNEVQSVNGVLDEVAKYADHILVVDDGSTDGTSRLLDAREDIAVVRHGVNRGYGAALISAFEHAIENDYEFLVTLDCDGQHQPQRIPRFVAACANADIVSGSRYLKQYDGDSLPPPERLFINRSVTRDLNQRLGLCLTDAFCGFKAYRVEALKQLHIEDTGYAMPLEVWVQAAMLGLRIIEVPVPLIYLDLNRSFGGSLDHAETRLRYYHSVLDRSMEAMHAKGFRLPEACGCCGECT